MKKILTLTLLLLVSAIPVFIVDATNTSDLSAGGASPEREQGKRGWKYGPNDERGQLNMITPASVLAALRLVREGKVYDLGVQIDRTTPYWPGHAPTEVVTFRTPSGVTAQGDIAFTGPETNPRHTFWISNYLIMSDQVGTQIDALNHITTGVDNHWYNGFTAEKFLGDFGPTRADAASMPPIVARGVLIDVAGAKSLAHLPRNYGISVDDLKQALSRQRMQLRRGDAVLIRTGTLADWPDRDKMVAGETSGLTLEAAQWLAEDQEVLLVAADNAGLEQNILRAEAEELLPVHRYLLIERGVPIGEYHYMEELARDRVYEFTYICLTNKIRGTTAGFALRPIAIR
jgi:kynurenine formamidase